MTTATTVENGKSAVATLAHLAAKATEGKILAEDLLETGKKKAQRMYRQGHDAAEECYDESTRYIKHNPWKSIGVALGLGLSLGFISGLFSRRR